MRGQGKSRQTAAVPDEQRPGVNRIFPAGEQILDDSR